MQKACDLVRKNAVVLDVGADHGFCATYLAEKGHKVYASEVKKGPFQILQSNLQLTEWGKTVKSLLMDGLEMLPNDVDTVLILGMGGKTIADILKRSENKLSQLNDIIIEPQSDFSSPIQFLLEHQFYNSDGCYIFEKHYYPLLRFSKGENGDTNRFAIMYGPIPYHNHDDNLLKYLTEKVTVIESLPKSIQSLHYDELQDLRSLIDEFKTNNC